ncbi:MAG: endonuclease/exonuclease/phosphatase family protein [Paracoccus sp. (in: a-proteobacteria)]|uniref:endonuclease/exonuclease/phosphatase family protein n=1 Tax=Paracoccus sp. TaxID=267 RepID=UPI0026E0ADCE|nr:endonuclease/exonuclease/phosphatase family protein [Paracoccus sp. (in: a-proteobacteria)]MDO5631333.1 endonuclease/exonuclease/phosphatase family protein [Paracoccus sp. (in: a-proteobacteria)]
MRLASYNLHKCRGMTGPHAPERNLAVIAGLRADVVALQEVDFRYGARPEALPRALVQEATGLVPADFTGTGEHSLGWHGQTLLLRPDLAAVAQVRRLPLPGIEPRGAIALRLPGLTVVALHLGLARSSRRAQLARLVARAARLGGGPVALMGDFNEWHDERGLESLAGWQVVAPGPTWPAPLPRLRLDRFALSRDLALRASGVFGSDIARAASDHLPIWAEIDLP